MICPLCGKRAARRACPAKGTDICPTCCATKRLREIPCPETCQYLRAARAHPPAIVQRQRERDLTWLMRLVDGLSPPQLELISLLTAEIGRQRASMVPGPVDSDVTDAAHAQAATLETAANGILYEHQAASAPAQRLSRIFREVLAQFESRQPRPGRESAAVFRRLETGSKTAAREFDGSETAFLDALDRLRQAADAPGRPPGPGEIGAAGSQTPTERRIILP